MTSVKITHIPPSTTEEKPDQFAAVKVIYPSKNVPAGKIVADNARSQPFEFLGYYLPKRIDITVLKHEVMIGKRQRIVVCETPAPAQNPYEMDAKKTLEVMKKAGIVSKSGKLTSRFK